MFYLYETVLLHSLIDYLTTFENGEDYMASNDGMNVSYALERIWS
jgi:hypothetical protein